MANDTRSGRKIKENDSNSSKRRLIGHEGSTTSGFATTDSSGLRRSTRETSSRNQSWSSTSIMRKSERLEKRASANPPIKRKFERDEEQRMPGPSKKSEGSEKQRSLNSSRSKKSEKGLSSPDTKIKREKKGKQQIINARGRSRNEKQKPKPSHVILKKKRLDTCSHRALLSSQARISKGPDLGLKLKRKNKQSQGASCHIRAGSSKEDEEEDECSERSSERRKEQEVGEFSHFSCKQENHHEENHEFESQDKSLVSETGNSSRQSSPDGAGLKEAEDNSKGMQVECSVREDFQRPELMESISEGRSLAGDTDTGGAKKVRTLKRKRNTIDISSDTPPKEASEEICSVTADAVSSSPSGGEVGNFIERCVVCSKRQRVDFDSCDQEFCSCNAKEVCVQETILTSVRKDGVSCYRMERENGAGDDPTLNETKLLPEVLRQIVDSSTSLGLIHEVLTPLEEDIKEPGAADGTRLIEECHSVGQDDEIPFILRVEVDQNACVVCKLGGKLLCCDGKWCKRNFHISCLDPPLKNVPPGVWYCFLCVKKKIELGVHSVSEQIESIWDVRQVDVSEKEGMQRQKQYLVKYKDLAHVHNRWAPESQLLQEVPLLVAKFNRKSQYVRWKPEWTIPHRLLQKRLLMSPKERDEYKRKHGTDISDCYHEWLVKWSDLGYEHVTWEFETSSFLRSNEAIKLIGDYESRHEKAKRASDPSREDKVQQELKGSFLELSKLPGGCPPELDCHLTFVNKIRECWHKGQNSFLIYDQERFMKVILFILSLQSDVCRPSLIVSSALSVWETEFLHLAPSINVVVYNGNSDVRKCIRALEFYEESGCLMFQVLLSTPDAVIEDLEVLECLGWEALIVDECQHSRVSKYFEQMKRLSTDFRLLVASGQIKDSLSGYLNLLAFLDSGGEGASPDGLKVDSSDNIGKLKERLTQFVPFECKSESSKFVEYWVPVELSNIQLEHYCSTLLSKEMSLRSCSKNDSVEALRDILISARKCCDHPYLLEPSLQSLLTKGLPEVEYLDVGIKASGKLQLLDKILQEMKRCGSRTLILFQSFGGSTLGDILDDFLRQRFGPDSYERVDGLVSPKKKQAAINMFNSRERGRFVFLLENRACHPSIKLSSVDTIILFDSDWNPLNDLRGLQRIHIDSQLERPTVFRLYTSCTVEEKILSLAKQDVSLDSNIQNINRSVCHMLLIWGASYLFSKLDGFHGGNTSDSDLNILSNESFMNAVVEELLIQLPQNADNCKKNNCSFISKVNQSVSTYSRDIPLLGESEMQLSDEEPPHVFWTKLLQGRYPRWRYLSGSSHRRRKRVQYFDESPRKSDIEGDEAIKKRKKVANNAIDPISLKPWLEVKRKVLAGGKEGTSGAQAGNVSPSLPRSAVMSDTNHVCSSPNEVSGGSDTHFVESEERRKLRDAQKSLHLLLKPEISKLCEILKLPGYIKVMAGRFLEYIMNNHHVNREPVAILQAFQISVCWTAAASFKHKIDHKESLAHVKQLLNFECKEEEVEFIFSKLWMLKKMFYRCMESSTELKSVEDSSPRIKYVSKILPCASSSQSVTSAQEELEGDIRDSFQSLNFPQYVLAKQVRSTDFDKTSWSQKNDFVNISQFNRICVKRIKKLLQKQCEEVQKFNKIRQKEKAKLEEELKSKLALIHTVHEHNSIRLVKIKMAEQDHAKKIEENNQHWEVLRKNLEALQLVARNREKQMEAHWLEQAKSWISVGLFSKLPLPVSGFRLEQMMACELGATQISGPPSEKSDPNITFPTKPGEVLPSVTETTPNKTTEASVPCCREGSGVDATLVTQPEREDGGTDATVSVQFNGDSNRIDTMLDMQPKREDDGMDASVVMQSNEDGNSLDATLDMLPNRGGDQVDFIGLDMLSNGDNNGLDGTVSMHSVRVEGIDATVFMQPHRNSKGMDSTYGMESLREDNATDATASEREILAGDEQHNMADNSNSVDLCSFEPIQIDSHSLSLPHVTAAQNSLFPLDELPCVEHREPPTAAAVQDEAALSCEMQNTPEHAQVPTHQPADDLPADESNHDTSVMGPVQRLLLLLSMGPPSTACDRQDESVMGTRHETTIEEHTSYQQAQIQEPLMDNPAESSNESDSTPPVEDQSEPSHSLLPPINSLPLHLPVKRPSAGSGALASDTSTTVIPESSNCPQVVHLVGSSTHVTGGVGTVPESSNHPPQPTTVATQMCQPRYPDPLQREMERLQKEKEETIKFHGDLKLRLESECDKEIEDIHRKYAALLQQSETALVQKRKALDANYNKVFINKMLAHAFRSKFSGQMESGAQGQPQGMPTSFRQQSFQLSSHRHAQRPATLSSPPAAPPLQVVHHTSALFSSNPVRQHISPVVPSAGNLQVASEPRAPAPHLRCFRPSRSMSAPNIQPRPHTIPGQQALGNAASTSSMVPQLASQPPTHSSGPLSRSERLERVGGLAGFSNRSLSALELLLDISNQPAVNPPSLLQPFPDLGLTLDTLDPSELTSHGILRGTAARTGQTSDVQFY